MHDTASESSFKHLIFGLRKMYALFEKEELLIKLPKLNRDKKLPVVLSTTEIRKLLCAPNNLYQRVLFGVIYDTGMRISEVRSLLISDVDFERKQVHIRLAKGKKDRYVTLSSHAVRGLKKHLSVCSEINYTFSPILLPANFVENTRHSGAMPVLFALLANKII